MSAAPVGREVRRCSTYGSCVRHVLVAVDCSVFNRRSRLDEDYRLKIRAKESEGGEHNNNVNLCVEPRPAMEPESVWNETAWVQFNLQINVQGFSRCRTELLEALFCVIWLHRV